MRSALPVGSSLDRVSHGSMPMLARAFSSSMYWVVTSVRRAPAPMAAAATVSMASARRCSFGGREHEGDSHARVEQASPGRVPVKVEQGRVGEDAHERVWVQAPGEFVDNGGVSVGQA